MTKSAMWTDQQVEAAAREIETFHCDYKPTKDDYRRMARVALEAATAWQPIETARADGATELWVYDAHSGIAHQAVWKEPFGFHATGGWYDMPFTGDGRRLARPTHWQPLPAGPLVDEERTEAK